MLIVNTITVFIVDTLPQQTTKILRKSVFDKDKYIYIVYATAQYVWSDIFTNMYGNIYILQHIQISGLSTLRGYEHRYDYSGGGRAIRGGYVILLRARMDPPLTRVDAALRTWIWDKRA